MLRLLERFKEADGRARLWSVKSSKVGFGHPTGLFATVTKLIRRHSLGQLWHGRARNVAAAIFQHPSIVQALLGSVFVVIGAVALAYPVGPNPVPPAIRGAVPFAIYYPNTWKLPRGCETDASSFSVPQRGVVLFAVNCPNGKLVLSEQQQPTREDIQKFYTDLIPHRQPVKTSLGKAEVGTLNSGTTLQSIVSIPVVNGPWIIITAPSGIDQRHVLLVVQSLVK